MKRNSICSLIMQHMFMRARKLVVAIALLFHSKKLGFTEKREVRGEERGENRVETTTLLATQQNFFVQVRHKHLFSFSHVFKLTAFECLFKCGS